MRFAGLKIFLRSIFNFYLNLVEVALLAPHKRTEGRAPVWGSEFTSKDAALLGGSIRNRC